MFIFNFFKIYFPDITKTMKLLKSFLLIGLFTLFITSSIFAQQPGSLTGQVYDSLGGVVSGAQVIAVDAAAKEKSAVTNKEGSFTIKGLAPGKYTVRVISPNFGLYENTEVVVAAGEEQELTVALSVESIKEVVDVDTSSGVSTDNENNASATVLKGKDLDALPDDPDDLEAALQALAGPSAGPNGGQIYIDGFTGGRMPPKEAIREIRINSNPFSAEFDRLGFGRIEILTKPGSDKFRGSAFFNFNDESLNSRNPFALNRAPSQSRFYGGNLSGPIQKGKSSFFLDFSNRDVDDNAVINANILDSSFNIVPFRQDITRPTKRLSFSPRIDYQLNASNTLVARYSYTRSRTESQGIGDLSLISRAFQTSSTEHEFRLTETAILNPKTVNETRFEYERSRRQQTGDNSIPTINVSGSFTGGGAQIGLNYTNDDYFELQNYTTTSLGKNSQHSLKFGGRLRYSNIEDRSEAGFGGTFTFAGVRDPLTGALIYSSIEQYRQKLLGNTDPRFNPSQLSITGGNPIASVKQYDIGVFATDDWKVRQDLTLSFGLRYENQNNISDNSNFAPRFSFAYSPGAGGARQPKTVFRGGFGIFYDRFNDNFTLQAARFNGVNQVQYIVTSNPAILGQAVFGLNGVTNAPTIAQIAAVAPGTFTIRQIADDLQSPTTYQYAFSVERQLPFKTRGAIYYVGSRSIHQLRLRNINAPVCPPLQACLSTALRPDPTQGNIFQYESSGNSNQQQLIFNVNSSLGNKITFGANYRLGFSKGDVDSVNGSAGGFPAYSYDLSGEYGNSGQDIRHFFTLFSSVQLPWNIRMSPFIIARSGSPYNITTGVDTNRDSVFNDRPTYTQLFNACTARGLNYSFCDSNGISDPSAIIPRNYGRGPGSFSVNLTFSKTIGFGKSNAPVARTNPQAQGGERGGGRGGAGGGRGGRGGGGGGFFGGGDNSKPYNLTFGLQISNLFNNVNLSNPVGNISSDRFGQSLSTGGGGGRGGGCGVANRCVQLQMRFSF